MIAPEEREQVDETLRWYMSMRQDEWSKNGGNKDGRKWKNLWTIRPGLSAEHLDTRIPANLCKYTGPDSVATGVTDDDIDSIHTDYSPTVSHILLPAAPEPVALATNEELKEISSLLSFMQAKQETSLSQSFINILNQTSAAAAATAEKESIVPPKQASIQKNIFIYSRTNDFYFDSEMNASLSSSSSSSPPEEEEEISSSPPLKENSGSWRKLKRVLSFLTLFRSRSVSPSPRKQRRLANLRRVTSEKIMRRSTSYTKRKTSFTPRGDSTKECYKIPI